MDYARGGGSSGAGFTEGGIKAARRAIVAGVETINCVAVGAAAIAAREQGTIDWQPSGAQGKRQGGGGSSDERGEP